MNHHYTISHYDSPLTMLIIALTMLMIPLTMVTRPLTTMVDDHYIAYSGQL